MNIIVPLLTLLVLFLMAAIVVSPFILLYWWRKIKKVKKNVPDNMEELIKSEKENVRRANEERKRRKELAGATGQAASGKSDTNREGRLPERRNLPPGTDEIIKQDSTSTGRQELID